MAVILWDGVELVRRHFGFVPATELTLWDDSMIHPGQKWDDEILRRLIRSRAAILIVTNNFCKSRYIRQHELPFLWKQHQHGHILLFWMLAEALTDGLEALEAPLTQIQATHDTARPLDTLTPAEMNAELVKIASHIITVLRERE